GGSFLTNLPAAIAFAIIETGPIILWSWALSGSFLWHATLISNSSEPKPYSQPGIGFDVRQRWGPLAVLPRKRVRGPAIHLAVQPPPRGSACANVLPEISRDLPRVAGLCLTRLSYTGQAEALGRGENPGTDGSVRAAQKGRGVSSKDGARLGTESSVPGFSHLIARNARHAPHRRER